VLTTRSVAGISLEYRPAEQQMPSRLKSVIALWFVLQIILPFTAPLQTCALVDLLPASSSHSGRSGGAPLPHESSATPLLAEAAVVRTLESSPVKAITLRIAMPLTPARVVVATSWRSSPAGVSLVQPVQQQTVLRL
jgi:hypothetical protein